MGNAARGDAEALAHRDAIIRDAIEANHGHLVKTTGDGAHAAFAIDADAIATWIAPRLLQTGTMGRAS